jgi:P27 family predicted phage terminase small subunit
MRGRKPKPTRLKILQGNPGRRPLNGSEPRPDCVVPRCPPHLKDEARKEWGRITADLRQLNLIARIDRPALAAYCMAWSRWIGAEKNIAQYGEVLISRETGIIYPSPYLAIANKAMEQMRRFLTEFGMTPSSRSRLSVSPASQEISEFEAFLAEGWHA